MAASSPRFSANTRIMELLAEWEKVDIEEEHLQHKLQALDAENRQRVIRIEIKRLVQETVQQAYGAGFADGRVSAGRPLPASSLPVPSPTHAPSATQFMAGLRSGMLSPDEARRQAQAMREQVVLHTSPPPVAPRHYQNDQRPHEGRYQAPPPPINERAEEWRRRHALKP